jgi:hypothetical protein
MFAAKTIERGGYAGLTLSLIVLCAWLALFVGGSVPLAAFLALVIIMNYGPFVSLLLGIISIRTRPGKAAVVISYFAILWVVIYLNHVSPHLKRGVFWRE